MTSVWEYSYWYSLLLRGDDCIIQHVLHEARIIRVENALNTAADEIQTLVPALVDAVDSLLQTQE